jgi:DNA-binding transcriptional LysR family regulator
MLSRVAGGFTQLQMFLAVARLGSVAKASAALGIPKVTVLAALRNLERESRVPLLATRGRTSELTEHGLAMEDLVVEVLTATGNLSAALGHQDPMPSGRVVVASAVDESVLPLGEWLGNLPSRCPLLVVEVRTVRHHSFPPRGADVFFTCEAFLTRGWATRKLMHIDYGLYGSVSYFERRHKPRVPGDLAVHSLIAGPRSSGARPAANEADETCTEAYFSRAPRLVTDSNIAALGAVAAGAGIGMLPVLLAERTSVDGLVPVLTEWRVPPDEVFIAYLTSARGSPRVAAVINEAVARASQLSAGHG